MAGGIRFDVENQLSVLQAVAVATPVVSTNSYQKQSATQDISIGRRLAIILYPTVAAGAGTSALIEAIQADDAALTTNVQSLASVTYAAAALVPGKFAIVPIPQGTMNKQFIGLRITLTGGTTTITFDAYLMPEEELPVYKSFPKAVDALV